VYSVLQYVDYSKYCFCLNTCAINLASYLTLRALMSHICDIRTLFTFGCIPSETKHSKCSCSASFVRLLTKINHNGGFCAHLGLNMDYALVRLPIPLFSGASAQMLRPCICVASLTSLTLPTHRWDIFFLRKTKIAGFDSGNLQIGGFL